MDRLVAEMDLLTDGWAGPLESGTPEGPVHTRMMTVAFFHAKLLNIHPYLDGNGRLSRLILWWHEWCAFGEPAGLPQPRSHYMAALPEASNTGNLRLLVNLFLARSGLPWDRLDAMPSAYPIVDDYRP